MRALELMDRVLLASLVPLWCLALALHVGELMGRELAQPAFYVSASAGEDFPVVSGARIDLHRGGTDLRPGDRVLSVGGVDAAGMGHIGFDATALARARGGEVALWIERDGERRQVDLPLSTPAFAWARAPVSAVAGVVAVLTLLLGPGNARSRLLAAAILLFLTVVTPFHGASATQTWASKLIHYLGVPVAVPLFLTWLLYFPDETPAPGFWARVWPWLFLPLYAVLRASFVWGGPVPPALVPASIAAADTAVAVACPAILAWNYRRANPVGRRRIKWVALGGFGAALPFALTHAAAALRPGFPWYGECLAVCMLAVAMAPIWIGVAVVSQHIFDVDRVIAAVLSTAILVWVLLALGLWVVPPLPGAIGSALGVVALGALAWASIPLRNAVERTLFGDYWRADGAVRRLLSEIPSWFGSRGLELRLGQEIMRLLGPRSCAVYARRGDRLVARFVRGGMTLTELGVDDPVVSLAVRRGEPLLAQAAAGVRGRYAPPNFERAALETLGVAVLVPVLRDDALVGVVCLGPKQSEDVYTSTELGWLFAICAEVSPGLALPGPLPAQARKVTAMAS